MFKRFTLLLLVALVLAIAPEAKAQSGICGKSQLEIGIKVVSNGELTFDNGEGKDKLLVPSGTIWLVQFGPLLAQSEWEVETTLSSGKTFEALLPEFIKTDSGNCVALLVPYLVPTLIPTPTVEPTQTVVPLTPMATVYHSLIRKGMSVTLTIGVEVISKGQQVGYIKPNTIWIVVGGPGEETEPDYCGSPMWALETTYVATGFADPVETNVPEMMNSGNGCRLILLPFG